MMNYFRIRTKIKENKLRINIIVVIAIKDNISMASNPDFKPITLMAR